MRVLVTDLSSLEETAALARPGGEFHSSKGPHTDLVTADNADVHRRASGAGPYRAP